MPPPGGPPLPFIRLEYRLRVRGIMLPRRYVRTRRWGGEAVHSTSPVEWGPRERGIKLSPLTGVAIELGNCDRGRIAADCLLTSPLLPFCPRSFLNRMKVQVPVPHSLQRVVHNPLYDMHESPLHGATGPAAPHLPAAAGGGMPPPAAGAVMAPPPAPQDGGGPGGAAEAGAAAAAGLLDDGGEGGLMDTLEDNLDIAVSAS